MVLSLSHVAEIVEGGDNLIHRNVTEILPQDQKKDAIDIVKSVRGLLIESNC